MQAHFTTHTRTQRIPIPNSVLLDVSVQYVAGEKHSSAGNIAVVTDNTAGSDATSDTR